VAISIKGCLLALWLLATSVVVTALQAQTHPCSAESGNANHWYSPVTQNAADTAPAPCATCQDPANHENSSCIVHRILLSEDCADGYCAHEQGEMALDHKRGIALQRSLRYEHPLKFLLDARNNCWFILWATEPVIGSEHAGARQQRPYWQRALEAAQTQVKPAMIESEVALLMHAANRRSQHQLHIHIGRLTPEYRNALDQAEQLSASAQSHAMPIKMHIEGVDILARLVRDEPAKAALQDVDVFAKVQAMLPEGAADMPRYTIMLARATDEAATWVLASEDLTRRVLDLSHERGCRL